MSTTPRRRRPSRPASAATVAATIAMFQPGDRDDVARAHGRERRGEVPIDAIAEADDDARRQARLRLGDRGREGIAGRPANGLEPGAGTIAPADGREGTRVQRPRDADPRQVVAVRPSGGASMRPETRTRSPGSTAGKRGSVADTRTGSARAAAPSPSRSRRDRVASCWPSLGDPIATTPAIHGPPSVGSGAAVGGESVAIRRAIAAHPTATGRSPANVATPRPDAV